MPLQAPNINRRTLLLGAAGVIAALLALVLALRIVAATDIGRGFVEARIEALTPRGQSIEIEGLAGDALSAANIADLTVSDEAGVWLRAEKVALEWSFWSLFAGEVAIKYASADQVVMLRRPNIAPGSGGSNGGFIKRYRIDRADLPNIVTAAEVTRAEAVFSASGRLHFGGRIGALDFELIPESAVGDRVDISLNWSPDAPLSGRARGSGPAGGILAQLLGLGDAAAPSFELTAERSEAVTDFAASLVVSDEVIAQAVGQLSHSEAYLDGDVDIAGIPALLSLQGRLGRMATVRLTASQDRLLAQIDTNVVEIQGGAPFNLNQFSLEDGVVDIAVEILDFQALAGRDDVDVSNASVKGRATQSRGDWVFVGEARAADLQLPGVGVDDAGGPVTLALNADTGAVSGGVRLQADGLELTNEQAQASIGASPEISLDFEYDRDREALKFSKAETRLAIGELDGRGRIDLVGGEVDFRGGYDLLNIGETTQIPIDAAQGRWSTTSIDDGGYNIRLDGAFVSLAGAEDLTAIPMLSGASYEVDARLSERGLESLVFYMKGEDIRVSGDLAVKNGSILGQGSANLAARRYGEAEIGEVAIEAELSGAVSQPEFEVRVTTPIANISGEQVANLIASASGQLEDGGGAAGVRLEAGWRDERLTVQSDIRSTNTQWSASDLDVQWAGVRAFGDVAGRGGDLERVRGDIALTVARGSPIADGGRGGVTLADGQIDARLRLLGSRGAGFDIAKADFDFQIGKNVLRGRVAIDGDVELNGVMQPAALNLDTRAALDAQQGDIAFDFHLDDDTVESVGPLDFSWAEGAHLFSGDLIGFGGDASFTLRDANDEGEMTVRWTNVALGRIGGALGRSDFEGVWSGDLRLTHDGQLAKGTLDSQLDAFGDGSASDRAEVQLMSNLENGRLTADLVISNDTSLDVKASAALPVISARHPYDIAVDPSRSGLFDAFGTGNIEALWSLVGPIDTRLSGAFEASSSYAGPMREFRPVGAFKLSDAVLLDEQTGVSLRELKLSSVISPDAITVDVLEARGGRAGRLTGAGRYAFDGDASLQVNLDRLNALERQDASISVSGDLSLGATPQGALLNGALRINEARISADALPRRQYPTLDVRFESEERSRVAEVPPSSPILMDVSVQADRRVYIVGPVFETEWALDVDVGGSLREPILVGRADVVRGDLDFVGRTFTFVDSLVEFSGAAKDAALRLRAEYDADALTAALLVTGTPDAPVLDLEAEPDLPQDEVLSHILFGESAASFGPLQAAQLAAAAASLSAGDLGGDFTGSLKDALGVDRLDFGSTADGAASLRAGQYVAPDVYIELNSSVRGAPGWGVEWTPWRSIEIGAEREAEDAPRLTVKWRRDFEFDPANEQTVDPRQ